MYEHDEHATDVHGPDDGITSVDYGSAVGPTPSCADDSTTGRNLIVPGTEGNGPDPLMPGTSAATRRRDDDGPDRDGAIEDAFVTGSKALRHRHRLRLPSLPRLRKNPAPSEPGLESIDTVEDAAIDPPVVPSRRRLALLTQRRETRVGLAALISFVILVVVLIANKSTQTPTSDRPTSETKALARARKTDGKKPGQTELNGGKSPALTLVGAPRSPRSDADGTATTPTTQPGTRNIQVPRPIGGHESRNVSDRPVQLAMVDAESTITPPRPATAERIERIGDSSDQGLDSRSVLLPPRPAGRPSSPVENPGTAITDAPLIESDAEESGPSEVATEPEVASVSEPIPAANQPIENTANVEVAEPAPIESAIPAEPPSATGLEMTPPVSMEAGGDLDRGMIPEPPDLSGGPGVVSGSMMPDIESSIATEVPPVDAASVQTAPGPGAPDKVTFPDATADPVPSLALPDLSGPAIEPVGSLSAPGSPAVNVPPVTENPEGPATSADELPSMPTSEPTSTPPAGPTAFPSFSTPPEPAPEAGSRPASDSTGPGNLTPLPNRGMQPLTIERPIGTPRSVETVPIPAPSDPRSIEHAPRSASTAALEPVPHIVQKGENFYTVARLYYGSGKYWKALWAANRNVVANPADLEVGATIRVPPPEALDRSLILPAGSVPRELAAQLNPGALDVGANQPSRDANMRRVGQATDGAIELPSASTAAFNREDVPLGTPEEQAPEYHIVQNKYETLRTVARDRAR